MKAQKKECQAHTMYYNLKCVFNGHDINTLTNYSWDDECGQKPYIIKLWFVFNF